MICAFPSTNFCIHVRWERLRDFEPWHLFNKIIPFSLGVLTYLVESDLGEYSELDKDSRDDEYNNETQDCRQDNVVFLQDLRT